MSAEVIKAERGLVREEQRLFFVWIDCTCGHWQPADWDLDWPDPMLLGEALDDAAEARQRGFPTKLTPA